MATVLCKLGQSGTYTSCLGVKTHVYTLAHTCTNTCHTSVCVYVCGVVCVCLCVCVCACVRPRAHTSSFSGFLSKEGTLRLFYRKHFQDRGQATYALRLMPGGPAGMPAVWWACQGILRIFKKTFRLRVTHPAPSCWGPEDPAKIDEITLLRPIHGNL